MIGQNDTHHKSFWRYIKKFCKDSTRIMSLTVDDIHNPKDKAEILNNQFYSVFTKADLSNIPKCTDHPNAFYLNFYYWYSETAQGSWDLERLC